MICTGAKRIAGDELLQAQVVASCKSSAIMQAATTGQIHRAGNGDGRQVLWQIDC